MTELEARRKIVDIAKSFLGSALGSAGHKKLIDTYNAGIISGMYRMTYSDPWCAATVSAWGMLAGMKDIVLPECSCSRMITLYQKHSNSRWEESDSHRPQIGDLIIYDWDDAANTFATTDNKGAPEHVGMIADVNGNTMTVIEGNISKSVGYRTMPVNGRYIRGYCLPAYNRASGSPAVVPTPAQTKTIDEIAREVISGIWGNNPQREKKLTAAGYDAKAVQARVNEILKGTTPLPPVPAPTPAVDIDAVAWEVIAGKWGNNPDRAKKLTAAGYDPNAVQARVNVLLKGETSSTSATQTQPSTSTATATEEVERIIWQFLKEQKLNDFAIAGIMGNLYAESALRPNNLQNSYEKSLGYTDDAYTAAVDSGKYTNFVRDSAGYGLAQWTYWSRKEALLKYAKNAGTSIGSLTTQMAFLWHELSVSYKGTLTALGSARSVREASDIFMTQFERPVDQSENAKAKRASYGQGYYDKYAGK